MKNEEEEEGERTARWRFPVARDLFSTQAVCAVQHMVAYATYEFQ